MEQASGAALSAIVIGVVLSAGVAALLVAAYRRRLLALMAGSASAGGHEVALEAPGAWPTRAPVAPDAAAQRAAERRVGAVIALTGALVGLSQAVLALALVYPEGGLTPARAAVLGLVYAWPTVLTWGLWRRWSWARTWAAVGVYLLGVLAVVLWRSVVPQPLATAGWLAGLVVLPVAVTALIGASGRLRAAAPYVLPFGLALAGASTLALGALAARVASPPAWMVAAVEAVGAWPAIALVALAPWLAVLPLAWWGARALARAYAAQRFSDLTYQTAAWWAVVLVASALPAWEGRGAVGWVVAVPWVWVLVVPWLARGWVRPRGPAPTLLVLRVFQRDAAVGALFDRVVERWRVHGPVVLIAGTDLLGRTLDPDDLFTFLDRRLAGRFLHDAGGVRDWVAALPAEPDPDGRYRVSEAHGTDASWRLVLAGLVARSDAVLMDLRGFEARHAGCRHELRVLAAAAGPLRVTVLVDAHTDRATAAADTAGAPAGRFVWLDTPRLDGAAVARTLGAVMRASTAG